MAQLSPAQYDALERSIAVRQRIAVYRRGTEYLVVPLALRMRDGREVIESVHPTTGEKIEFRIDDVDRIEVIA